MPLHTFAPQRQSSRVGSLSPSVFHPLFLDINPTGGIIRLYLHSILATKRSRLRTLYAHSRRSTFASPALPSLLAPVFRRHFREGPITFSPSPFPVGTTLISVSWFTLRGIDQYSRLLATRRGLGDLVPMWSHALSTTTTDHQLGKLLPHQLPNRNGSSRMAETFPSLPNLTDTR